MEVTFTKLPGRRYTMTVRRDRGPVLAPRQGPGYDDFVPHDLVHLVAEQELGLTDAVFGQIAAGQSNIFLPADPAVRSRQRRREDKRRATARERDQTARSEAVASAAQVLWELRAGRLHELPEWFGSIDWSRLDRAQVDRVVDRLDVVARRWHDVPVDGSLCVDWDGVRPRVTTP